MRLERAGESLSLSRRKVESLFAYLILHPEEHPREQLAALLWGDFTDQQARASLRTRLSQIREYVGAESILADRNVVQLNPAFPIWVDAREMERQAKLAPETAPSLYRGELLAGFDDAWVLPFREHYRRIYINTLLKWAQALRSKSEYKRAIEIANQILATDPANERGFQHLMFCYMAIGNRPAAVETYDRCVQTLAETLDVEPSAETQELARWIKQTAIEKTALLARITNLPIPLTSFIGRTHETAEVKSLLKQARLVTLTGAGGTGKTRLSIQVGMDLLDAFKAGVWWVELGSVMDPEIVPKAVAKTLGIAETI
ncbi:MAG: BTAD domain-containing putative transcriptional regulator, partial [Anaerolineae bacterium]